ncbi:MAG: methyltransferase [Proteobacteria bacterium]|nr:methyltransferase [Pseudomonadota bacterium]
MSETIVSWHFQQKVKVDKLEKLELFIEIIEATIDIEYSEIRKESLEINIFIENQENLDKKSVEDRLKEITGLNPDLKPVYENDWQQSTISSFPPIEIGQFVVYSFDENFDKSKYGEDRVVLEILPQMAFGTGEHSTTKGCLMLLEKMQKRGFKFKNALDMGCGSAILSMAVAKSDNVKVLAVDNDEICVNTSKENIKINSVEDSVEVLFSEGFADSKIQNKAPFDLIFANIFKNPLLEMSEELVNSLEKGGVVILSGFKDVDQKDEIIKKYVNELGLTLLESFAEESWAALTLRKS